jgi:hypothetical protein
MYDIQRLWSLIHRLNQANEHEVAARAFLQITELLNPKAN